VAARTVSEIWIYPVKSLGGIRLRSARVQEKGLQFDRRWMLTDENGKFLTQRKIPRMALFKLHQQDGAFHISFEKDTITLPSEAPAGAEKKAAIWGDEVMIAEAPDSFHQWFSDRLERPCRLVAFPESNERLIDAKYRPAQENVSIADGHPLLVIGQASLDDLNTRLEQPVPMNRFRPNLVFTGGAPFEEDAWRKFSVGKNRFLATNPCGRCVLTTVNQDTGVQGREPLLTLSRYRKKNEGIYFGMNVIPVDYTEIYEGEEITVE